MPPKSKKAESDTQDFKKYLDEIAEILAWFDDQDQLDIEQALKKVRDAANLIKASKKRLGEIENEFEEIKKEIEAEE